SGARVDGNVISAATVPPASATRRADHVNYKVRLDGNGSLPAQVGGNLTACGPKTGSGTVAGITTTPPPYTAAPPTKTLPAFTYSASNYDPLTLHEFPPATAIADFQSYVSAHASLSGTFYVNQSSPVNQGNRIVLTGVTISGDMTIITNAPIFIDGNTPAPADAIVVLVSTYQPPASSECDVNQDSSECSIHLKNNFQVGSGTTCDTSAAALIYAPYGPVAVKNNATQCGTIYSDNIQIKNNQTLAYDARVERVVGFGEVTLEIASWVECPPAGC
ncbi:MAG: hypothetical protein HY775_05155, partial [Acidobacteria bacterium]|nr:hypothetical protein [Acidobacteriota bacterium]